MSTLFATTELVDVDTVVAGDIIVRAHGLGVLTVAALTWDPAQALWRVDFTDSRFQWYGRFDQVDVVTDPDPEPAPNLVRIRGRLYDVDALIEQADRNAQDRWS